MSDEDETAIRDALAGLTASLESLDLDGGGYIPFRELFHRVGEVRGTLKNARFAKREEHQECWERLNRAADSLQTLRNEFRRRCDEDKRNVDGALAQLEESFESAQQGHVKWSEFWVSVQGARAMVKQARFHRRDDRKAAWALLERIVQKAEFDREQRQGERELAEFVSRGRLESILASLRRADPDRALEDWTSTEDRLGELKHHSSKLQEAKEELEEYYNDLTRGHAYEARQAIRDMKHQLDAAWERWRERVNDEHVRKRDEYISRMFQRRERLEEFIARKEAYILRREANVAKLYDMRASARSDDRQSEIDGWIVEEEQKIESAKEEQQDLEAQLEKVKSDLSELE